MKVYVFPGQGSQIKGMGAELFQEFKEYTEIADSICGYSVEKLCLEDSLRQLSNTEFTQPALYVVNCLTYLKRARQCSENPDFILGHSLGEYCALFAAGAYDFETGLKLVKKRGELMSKATNGSMAAILNLDIAKIREVIVEEGYKNIDVANLNSSVQTVISGAEDELKASQVAFEKSGGVFVPLNVSAAFHSRFMKPVADEFEKFLYEFRYSPLVTPVVANIDARPYRDGSVIENLTRQLYGSVQWEDSIRYLMGMGSFEFEELGPGDVLTKLIKTILQKSIPILENQAPPASISLGVKGGVSHRKVFKAENLGSKAFRDDYGLRYAYYSGAMYKGIGSKEIVVRMAKAGFMGVFGAGGLGHDQVERDIRYIKSQLNEGQIYGVNLLHQPGNVKAELDAVDLYLEYGVRALEASAFTHITPALVKYKLNGLSISKDGKVESRNKIIAKISRPEIALAFMSPAPQDVVSELLKANQVTSQQAKIAEGLPLADDICAESNSGGHTDGAVPLVLLPTMLRLRDRVCRDNSFSKKVRVGAAGGIGTPEAVAAMFMMGADFVVTGSINQCTVEAGTSDRVKDMLQKMNIQDSDFAPAGDMFEVGAKIQVLKKGVFFPARANKLYELWRNHGSWGEIETSVREQIEKKYFSKSFEHVYRETRDYYQRVNPAEIVKAEKSPKHKMALVFRWYFVQSSRLALTGDSDKVVDFQIHTGPAMGAFNQWVLETELYDWRNRHVDQIATKLMLESADVLNSFYG